MLAGKKVNGKVGGTGTSKKANASRSARNWDMWTLMSERPLKRLRFSLLPPLLGRERCSTDLHLTDACSFLFVFHFLTFDCPGVTASDLLHFDFVVYHFFACICWVDDTLSFSPNRATRLVSFIPCLGSYSLPTFWTCGARDVIGRCGVRREFRSSSLHDPKNQSSIATPIRLFYSLKPQKTNLRCSDNTKTPQIRNPTQCHPKTTSEDTPLPPIQTLRTLEQADHHEPDPAM